MLASIKSTGLVASAAVAVTVAEAKAQARVDHAHEDDLIQQYIHAAVDSLEQQCRAPFRRKQIRAYYTNVSCGVSEFLPGNDVSNVSVSCLSGAAAWSAVACSTLLDANPAQWYAPKTVALYDPKDGSPQWKAEYQAGYTAANLPSALKQAILLLTANLYESRTPIVIGTIVAKIPDTIDRMIAPYKIPTEAGF